jgi:hypothetical protein
MYPFPGAHRKLTGPLYRGTHIRLPMGARAYLRCISDAGTALCSFVPRPSAQMRRPATYSVHLRTFYTSPLRGRPGNGGDIAQWFTVLSHRHPIGGHFMRAPLCVWACDLTIWDCSKLDVCRVKLECRWNRDTPVYHRKYQWSWLHCGRLRSHVILRESGVGEPPTAHWKSSLNSPSIVDWNDICMDFTIPLVVFL